MSVWELYTQLFARNWRCGRFAQSLSQGCSEKIRKKDVVVTAGSSRRDSIGRGQHSSNWVSGISSRTMHQSTTPSFSQTIWPRWASRHFLSLNPDLAPCDFCLFPKLKEKLRGCHYETIEEMKEAVMKVTDTLTQEDFHGDFQKLLEWYNKCMAAEGDYFEGD